MAAVATRRKSRLKYENVGDLLHALGDISPDRLALDPPLGQATVRDLIRMNERKIGGLYEYVDGVLVRKAMSRDSSSIGGRLMYFLTDHVERHDLGDLTGSDHMFRFLPKLIREPDLAFTSWERLGRRGVSNETISDVAPELAVEVLSPSNTPAEMARKREEYFRAGVLLVWIIDPENRAAAVYTAPDAVKHLTESNTLDGGDVLPGFRLPLKTLFAKLAKRPPKKKNGRGRV